MEPFLIAAAKQLSERDIAFNALADAQRGAPERATLRIQHHPLGPGMYGWLCEHVGDLTHRMAEHTATAWETFGYEFVKEKVDKTLRALANPYGIDREIENNRRNNFLYHEERNGFPEGATLESMVADLRRLGKAYAQAHQELKTHNYMQQAARNAAVAIGYEDYEAAADNLRILDLTLKKGPEAWANEAGKFGVGVGKTAKTARTALTRSEAQRMESLISSTEYPGFILPDGRKIDAKEDSHLGHTRFIYDDPDNDRLDEFLKSTGAVRVVYPEFTGEKFIAVEMYKIPTPSQIRAISETIHAFGSRYILWSFGRISGEGSIGDFQRAVDSWKKGKQAKTTAQHATTQINLPEELAWKIRKLTKKIVSENNLMADGYEENPHITLRYGLLTENDNRSFEQEQIGKVRTYLAEQPSFTATLGKTHVFPPSPSSDGAAVVVIEISAPELHRMNKELEDVAEFKKSDFPDYIPHATLAYIKPETAEQYDKKDWFEGVKFEADSVTVSFKDHTVLDIPLKKSKTAGNDNGSALTIGADSEDFPVPLVVRFPQKGMRWRTVLKIVKQIVGEVAGRRIPWRDIHVWENPWSGYAEQQEQFPRWAEKRKFVMYDIYEDGTFKSVGKPHTPSSPPPKYRTVNLNASVERITKDGDNWKCICGNEPHLDGFFTSTKDGVVVAPDANVWDGRHFVCDRCGRIIDQKTLRVVGQKQENLFIEDDPRIWTKIGVERIKGTPGKNRLDKWDLECICGNTRSFAFRITDENGEKETDPERANYLRCLMCNRIIDLRTLKVVGVRRKNLFGDYVKTRTAVDKTAIEMTEVSKSDVLQSLNWEWNTANFNGKNVGKFEGFDVEKGIISGLTIFRISDKNRVVGYVSGHYRKGTFAVDQVSFYPKYRGLNLPAKFYTWLLNNDIVVSISSGRFQSAGGRSIWEQLAKMPGIQVFGWNRGKVFSLDPEDLSSEETVWSSDIEEELIDLQNEYAQYDVKHLNDAEAKVIKNRIRELERDWNDASRNTILVAQKTSSNRTATHKVTPLDDSMYQNPDIGEETNAYADIPERVKDTEMVPSLEELIPEEFEKSGAQSLGLHQIDLDFLIRHGGGLYDMQGGWDKITEEARQKTENFDKLPEDEQEKLIDQIGMEWLQRTWQETEKRLRSLKFPLVVYRGICASEGIDGKKFGTYWSYDENNAYVHRELAAGCGDVAIFRGIVEHPGTIDWIRTSYSNLVAEDEREIDVLPGTRIKITGWKKRGESAWHEPTDRLRLVTAAGAAPLGKVPYTGEPYATIEKADTWREFETNFLTWVEENISGKTSNYLRVLLDLIVEIGTAKPRFLLEDWTETTGLSDGSLRDYLSQLRRLLKSYRTQTPLPQRKTRPPKKKKFLVHPPLQSPHRKPVKQHKQHEERLLRLLDEALAVLEPADFTLLINGTLGTAGLPAPKENWNPFIEKLRQSLAQKTGVRDTEALNKILYAGIKDNLPKALSKEAEGLKRFDENDPQLVKYLQWIIGGVLSQTRALLKRYQQKAATSEAALLSKIAVFAEAQSQVQHSTYHPPVGMYKVRKSDPFSEEWDLFGPKDRPEDEEPEEPKPSTSPSDMKSLLNRTAAAKHFQPLPFEQFARKHWEYNIGDKQEDRRRYEENVEHFSAIKFPLTLYRAMELEAGQEPNWNKMGVHWTWAENSADTYFGSGSIWRPYDKPKLRNSVMVVVKARLMNPYDVDWDNTLIANMINPEENEVWLEPEAQLKLLGVDYGKGYQSKSMTITASNEYVWAVMPFTLRHGMLLNGHTFLGREYVSTEEEADEIAKGKLNIVLPMDVWRIKLPEDYSLGDIIWAKPQTKKPSPAQTAEMALIKTFRFNPKKPDKPDIEYHSTQRSLFAKKALTLTDVKHFTKDGLATPESVEGGFGHEPDYDSKDAAEKSSLRFYAAKMTPTLDEFIQKAGGLERLFKSYDAHDDYKSEAAFYRALKNKYKKFMQEVQSFPLIVYREVDMKSVDDLETQHIGTSWTTIPIEQGAFWNRSMGQAFKPFIFKAEVGHDDIAWQETMWNRFYPSLGEQESEITLKSEVPVKIVGVKAADDESWQPYGKSVTAKGQTIGQAYLLHFDIPAGTEVAPERTDASQPFHARHYLGWAENAQKRIEQHYEGDSGVKLINALHRKDIGFTVARIWNNVDRSFERQLKSQGGLPRHCPICDKLGLIPASRRREKALQNVQVAPETPDSGPDFMEV